MFTLTASTAIAEMELATAPSVGLGRTLLALEGILLLFVAVSVHAQYAAGVIKENIRANTNLRIALRVSDPAESIDVIGVQDAARIGRDRPGRAFARTGHGELTEIQVAYAGGSTPRATAR